MVDVNEDTRGHPEYVLIEHGSRAPILPAAGLVLEQGAVAPLEVVRWQQDGQCFGLLGTL